MGLAVDRLGLLSLFRSVGGRPGKSHPFFCGPTAKTLFVYDWLNLCPESAWRIC
jgi:hypothetical protein